MSAAGATLRLLAVEDSAGDAHLLEAYLEAAGAGQGLVHVRTLAAAEIALAREEFDVVLLDLGLPDGDGIEIVKRIRAAAARTAVVVLTGRDDDSVALQALSSGAQEYLVKGDYDGATLLRTIRHAIQRHRLMMELADQREREYFRASHDALTGLPNRQLFLDRAATALSQVQRGGENFALCFIDLDGFKPVNDGHGHLVGDILLRQIADTLRASLRNGDTVARLGGDEFLLLLTPIAGARQAELIVQRLLGRIAAIRHAEGHEVNIGASAGIAVHPLHGDTVEVLMARADEAMYRAKRAGKGRAQVWSPVTASVWQQRQSELRAV